MNRREFTGALVRYAFGAAVGGALVKKLAEPKLDTLVEMYGNVGRGESHAVDWACGEARVAWRVYVNGHELKGWIVDDEQWHVHGVGVAVSE